MARTTAETALMKQLAAGCPRRRRRRRRRNNAR